MMIKPYVIKKVSETRKPPTYQKMLARIGTSRALPVPPTTLLLPHRHEATTQHHNSRFPATAAIHQPGDLRFFSAGHPWRLTWNLQITQLSRKIIFQTIIFRFHVNLPGCLPPVIFVHTQKKKQRIPSRETITYPHKKAFLSRWCSFFPRWDMLIPFSHRNKNAVHPWKI